jgi:uncharacterized membrane protein YfcA
VVFAFTILIGLSIGALGSGGAILMLPLLVYINRTPVEQAVPMSLAVVAVTSAAGALGYIRGGSFNPKLAAVFGTGGVAGALVGSAATRGVPAKVLMLLFASLLLFVGVRMLASRAALTCANPCLPARCFLIAFGIGLLTGFLGVGGGFLLVPALQRYAGLDQRSAVGTSLSLTSVNSLAGLGGHLRYQPLDWMLAGQFLIFALIGLGVGLIVSRWAPARALNLAFAWLLIGIGGGIAAAQMVGFLSSFS